MLDLRAVRRCGKRRRVVSFRSCGGCGCLMPLTAHRDDRRRRFCSRSCAARSCPIVRVRLKPSRSCLWCGRTYRGRRATCGDLCGSYWRRFNHPRWLNHKRIYWRVCPGCHRAHYVTNYSKPASCSKACASLVARKMVGPGKWSWIARDERWLIYERDSFTCQLCHQLVDMSQAGTSSPNAPSLDHIVPRSFGGDDSPSNLRLAHHRCNSMRGNRLFEQLVLL